MRKGEHAGSADRNAQAAAVERSLSFLNAGSILFGHWNLLEGYVNGRILRCLMKRPALRRRPGHGRRADPHGVFSPRFNEYALATVDERKTAGAAGIKNHR
ncbi:MAG: hypothetical protein HDQ87_11400 [Clostridia bacterium]|nr:hypothetical protein [Clostridia bacterium]